MTPESIRDLFLPSWPLLHASFSLFAQYPPLLRNHAAPMQLHVQAADISFYHFLSSLMPGM